MMELVKLNSTRQADTFVNDYDSLIWTERYNTVGDFQLTTGQVEKFMALMPEGSLMSLVDSRHTMQVETHKIERKKGAAAKLTITGRSWESILDRRVSLRSLTDLTEWKVGVKTPSDAAWFIANQICVAGVCSPLDIFAPFDVLFPVPSDYLASTGPAKEFPIQRGNLLSVVLGLLQTEAEADPLTTPATPAIVPHGIRAYRPTFSGTAVQIQIYVGIDRSATIAFDGNRDSLDDGTYLFSKVGSANAGYLLGPTVTATMHEGVSAPTGLNRRVMLLDGASSEVNTVEGLRHQGSYALADAKETALFDGSINQDLMLYKYGTDYDLGDIVRLDGDYGLSQKARVTEFIRSDDATGIKEYPTLTALPA